MKGGKRRELIVSAGDFTGTVNDLIEYLGQGSRSGIFNALRNGTFYRGLKIKRAGFLKHCTLYGLLKDGKLADYGPANELAERYHVSQNAFSVYSRNDARLCHIYDVIRLDDEIVVLEGMK